ncbi:BrnT family toxin, partial [Acinetobacter baumannii]
DRHTNGEERWQTIGMVKGVLMLLVAHTIIDDDDCEIIRIISARQVTKAERNQYEHG